MKLIAVFLLLGTSLISQNSILWEISGKGIKDKSYLYGTIHLANKKYFHVNPKVHEVKNKVDGGVFEIELRQDSLAFISFAMMAKPGEKIDQICSEDEQKLIFDYFKKYIGLEQIITNNFSPIALNTLMFDAFVPSDTIGAIDQLLQNDFKKAGKPVYALESIRFQSELLTAMPIELQKESLLECINDLDSVANTLKSLDSAYINQDLLAISKLLNDLEDEEYFNKALLNDSRNVKMVQQLPAMMKKESLLIAVGAAHLGGEEGLIMLLRKEGYTLTPIF